MRIWTLHIITNCFSSHFEPRRWVTHHQWDSITERSRRSTCTLLISNYLSMVKNRHLRNTLMRFRSGIHWLHICQGRYSKTPRDMRCCPNCTGVIEDEQHALFDCPVYADLWESLVIYSMKTAEPSYSCLDLTRTTRGWRSV
jgi:hypothetical protein